MSIDKMKQELFISKVLVNSNYVSGILSDVYEKRIKLKNDIRHEERLILLEKKLKRVLKK